MSDEVGYAQEKDGDEDDSDYGDVDVEPESDEIGDAQERDDDEESLGGPQIGRVVVTADTWGLELRDNNLAGLDEKERIWRRMRKMMIIKMKEIPNLLRFFFFI